MCSLSVKSQKFLVCTGSIDRSGFVFSRIAKIAFRISPKVTMLKKSTGDSYKQVGYSITPLLRGRSFFLKPHEGQNDES